MWPFRKKASVPTIVEISPVQIAASQPPVDLLTQPMNVGGIKDPVAYAIYRLDAIERHMGDNVVTDRFRQEARTEAFSLLHTLSDKGILTPDLTDKALRLVGVI